jgi:hypothetical protein
MAQNQVKRGRKLGTHCTEEHRALIETAKVLKRLQAHFFGEIDLTPTQIRVAEILLRKTVPDLSQTDITDTVTHRYVVEVSAKLTREEWIKEYSPRAQPTIQ